MLLPSVSGPSIVHTAVNAVVDKASVIIAEDLTSPISGKKFSKNVTRRLSAWTKGVIAQLKTYLAVEVLRSFMSMRPIPHKWTHATGRFRANEAGMRFTVQTGCKQM